jgi:hypothetical protein
MSSMTVHVVEVVKQQHHKHASSDSVAPTILNLMQWDQLALEAGIHADR